MPTDPTAAAPIVETEQGRLQGLRDGRLSIFHGVPYAEAGRFEPPRPHPAWPDVRQVTERGPICPQAPFRFEFVMGAQAHPREQSEACQRLSIYSPDLAGKRPVMVWIHGGAYVAGGGEEDWYDASRLADEGDVVTVTITYRLGVFGYLHADEPERRNLGLQDQIAALQWLRRNIASFGGDPDRVTLFGQSAGAHAVAALIAVDRDGLFGQAILQSMPGIVITESDAREVRRQVEAHVGKPLDTAAHDAILAAQTAVSAGAKGGMPFGPVGIDILHPDLTWRTKPLPVLFTWTRHDANAHVAMRFGKPHLTGLVDWAAAFLATRNVFSKPAKDLAAHLRQAGHRASTFEITWSPAGSPFHAVHCVELPLLFGKPGDWANATLLGSAPRQEIEQYGREAKALWAAFAQSGTPPRRTDWLRPA